MKKTTTKQGWLIGLVIGLVALIGIMIGMYNSLVKSEQAVESQWSQVETVLQRRYDLIPNLVSAVKGSMKHEDKVFSEISSARKAYGSATTTSEKIKANAQLDQSVGTLVNVIGENYPKLQSNENVQTLMTQLEGSENRISVERRRYNQTIESYNKSVATFPKNILAGMMGFQKKAYFKADTKASTAPVVDLDD
ncbi:LemA family protein [Lapidilactobacillus luobeiensis]|uniref:LemA family protein n=1 Tax=Lapidilactobacillus luobeiensis TaxID=2950371 RepID=UPI0021C44175|nr:LemA family protein [Lapidilactobacillus luobeiensis]